MPVRTVRRMKDGPFARMENRAQSVPILVRSVSLNMPVSMAVNQDICFDGRGRLRKCAVCGTHWPLRMVAVRTRCFAPEEGWGHVTPGWVLCANLRLPCANLLEKKAAGPNFG